MEPSVLLLDEPAAGLSEIESRELASLVSRLAKNWGLAVLLVEHDMDFVMGICDDIIVVDFGNRIAAGTPAEIQQDELVRAAYLGGEVEPDIDEIVAAEAITSTEEVPR
jgi:sulfate-transporting ATPase